MKITWFLFFFLKSVRLRKGRIALSGLAVMLAVAMITGMLCLTVGIRSKLGEELKSYGANVIISPATGEAFFDREDVRKITSVSGTGSVTGQFLGSVLVEGSPVELIGMEMSRIADMGWKLEGTWPQKRNELLVGSALKSSLKAEVGSRIRLTYEGTVREYVVSGFTEKGGQEDRAFIMSLESVRELAGTGDVFNTILVRGPSDRLDSFSSLLQNTVPGSSVRTVKQVARAEESLLGKIQLLMGMVTVVVLGASVVTVTATTGANVLERRVEIGLMKALGGTMSNVRAFFLAEAVLTGLAGGLAGYLAGVAVAEAVSQGAFNSYIPVPLFILLISVAVGVMVSVASSYFPVAHAVRSIPAVILREG